MAQTHFCWVKAEVVTSRRDPRNLMSLPAATLSTTDPGPRSTARPSVSLRVLTVKQLMTVEQVAEYLQQQVGTI